MSDLPPRDWELFVEDMIECSEQIIEYTAGFDHAGFVASRLHYDATVRNLEVLGEAATHIPSEIRAASHKSRGAASLRPAIGSSTAILGSIMTSSGASSSRIFPTSWCSFGCSAAALHNAPAVL